MEEPFARRRPAPTVVVAAAAAVLLAAHLALVLLRHGPILVADEIGYLTNARAIAGGAGGQMAGAGFTHGGYSLLLATVVRAAAPLDAYRLALAVNAVLAASLVPLLYLLLRRLGAAPRTSAAIAIAAALYPSATILAQVTMSENLLYPGYVVWLIAAIEVTAGGRRARAAALALAASSSLLLATHGRMIVTFGLAVVVLLAAGWRRSIGSGVTILGLAGLGAGWICARLLDDLVVRRSYGGERPNEVTGHLSSLSDLHAVVVAARSFVGQSWYLLVATLGLPVAAAAAARARRDVFAATRPVAAAAILFASAVGLLFVSAVAFPDPYRPDHWIYGRYTEIVAPPAIAVAAWAVARAAPAISLRVTGAVIVAATLLIVALRPTVHTIGGGNRWDVVSLPAPPLSLGAAALALSGVAAAFWVCCLVLAARRGDVLLAVVLVAAFVFPTANTERNPLRSGDRDVYGGGWTDPGAVVDPALPVRYDTRQADLISRYAYQWWFPHARFTLTARRPGRSFRGYLVAPTRAAPGGRVVWRDPNRPEAVYEFGAASPP